MRYYSRSTCTGAKLKEAGGRMVAGKFNDLLSGRRWRNFRTSLSYI